jgi:EAL domain-containing protein (putative c-di-GMP-specific phosphodiesterase class I)
VHLGDATPLDFSYGQQIADGRLPYMIRDTRADPRTRDLPLTKVAGTGAYVGVPITRSGGDQFGVLYGLSHRAEPSLGERDVRLIQILAKMVSEEIERASDAGAGQRASHSRIQRMVSGEGISIVLQPIIELSSGRVIAAEALTRFVSTPRRPPNEWFSEAVSAGLGVELELAAISVAITKLGHLPPRARLSINASPQTLLSEGFRAVVAGVPGARLAVELTEHAPVDDYHALTTALASLRATGVQLMVDDAGAGFASLKHILGLRPDVIKLDLALTRDIDTDPMRRALTASLVGFGREISATLVAEGIETRSALETLRALGVTYGQGHFLARPTRGRVSERVDLGDGSRAAAQRPRHPHHDGSAGMRRVQRPESAVLASDL